MSPDAAQPDRDRLEAYIDGLMSPQERAAFERTLEDDPQLRAELHRQAEVDRTIARLFAPSASDSAMSEIDRVSANGRASVAVPPLTHAGRRRWLAAAAAIALLAFSGYRMWIFLRPGPEYPWKEPQPAHVVYAQAVQTNLTPEWVCETDQEFMDTFRRRLREPLLLAQADVPEHVELRGLAYPNIGMTRTIMVLARVRGSAVVVFADRASADRDLELPAQTGLKRFRRQVGGLVLYEVTPLDRPHLLNLFQKP